MDAAEDIPAAGESRRESLELPDLYAAHAGWVRAYLRRCGFSPHDVDDLAQDVFVRAMRSLHTFDAARGPVGPWLATIARNVARRRWQSRRPCDSLDPELAEAVLVAHENPAATPESREQVRALGDCVGALPTELASLVRLRYVDGLTTRAVAEAASTPEATVRLRLSEAMRLLEQCLEKKGVWE